jgi:hypothetical protein
VCFVATPRRWKSSAGVSATAALPTTRNSWESHSVAEYAPSCRCFMLAIFAIHDSLPLTHSPLHASASPRFSHPLLDASCSERVVDVLTAG